jgi:hypothetical protein
MYITAKNIGLYISKKFLVIIIREFESNVMLVYVENVVTKFTFKKGICIHVYMNSV